MMFSMIRIDELAVEGIAFRIVAVDFEYLGDVSASWPALDVDHDVQGIGGVCFDGAIRKVNATLQYATGETSKPLLGRVRLNGGKRPGMSGVQELQKIEGFAAANFA